MLNELLFYTFVASALLWIVAIFMEFAAQGARSTFFWRTYICVIPCIWAGYVTALAVIHYVSGEPGGFKFGVDLEGGTILVYEIDLKKKSESIKDNTDLAKTLAKRLKDRIDPNDLKNIVIRPAGENRVEIILPTGGVYRTQKAEEAWKALVDKVAGEYTVNPDKLNVDRGNPDELADRIQSIKSQETWDQTFKDKKAWKRLIERAYGVKNPEKKGEWLVEPTWPELPDPNAREEEREPVQEEIKGKDGKPVLDDKGNKVYKKVELKDKKGRVVRDDKGHVVYETRPVKDSHGKIQYRYLNEKFRKAVLELEEKPANFDALTTFLQRELGRANPTVPPPSEIELKNWIKREAWRAMLDKVYDKWKAELKDHKEELYRIQADSHEQLVSFIYCKGNVMDQAMLNTVSPLLGLDFLNENDFGNRAKIKEFVEKNYGPSLAEIRKRIREETEKTGRSQDLTVEEVQRIKDLVSKVGSLEFLMLANSNDDKKAIEEAQKQIDSEEFKMELEDRQKEGLPPRGPCLMPSKVPEKFTILLPHNNKSIVTYRWVELGPQERKQLGLDNASEFQPERNAAWVAAKLNRGKAITLPDMSPKPRLLLQGALFYSRECLNRNLPEDQRRDKKVEYFVLARNPEIDPNDPLQERETPPINGDLLTGAQAGQGGDLRPAVHFQFNAAGATLFGDLTRKNVPSETGDAKDQIKRHLAIVLDGQVMSAPTILSQINGSGQITGSFTQKEVDALVNILRSGSLPATLKPQPVSESTMGPQLGRDTIVHGVRAIVVAFAAVLIFMVFYYRFAGLVASVALLANLLLTIGFMIGVQATFTLPGLAGLVLMVGMAVDANVLIYERLREERDRGASLALAIRNGYDRALPIIIDTHLTGIFTAVVLYVVGNDQLRGFGVSLTVGLIISLFTSLYMTRLMFDFWLSRNWLHKLSMFRLFTKPNIDFMGIRNAMFAATITMAVLGGVLFVARGANGLNIDFIGGTAFGGKLIEPMSMSDLRQFVDEKNQSANLSGVKVKELSAGNSPSYQLTYPGETPRTVTLPSLPDSDSKEEREKLVAERAGKLPDPSVEQLFPSFDPKNVEAQKETGDSMYFIIRTSEKAPELVQAMLDRLLRKDGKALMDRIYVKMEAPDESSKSLNRRLDFYKKDPGTNFDNTADLKKPAAEQLHTPASPSYVKTLIRRHLTHEFAGEKIPEFDLIGVGQPREGRYSVMNFIVKTETVGKLSSAQKEKIHLALAKAVQEFVDRPQPDRLETFDSQLAAETQYRAMAAIIASWGAILVYLWFRFGSWTFGLAAVICLIHDLFFTLGAIAACHFVDTTFIGHWLGLEDFKIDLPAVAALLTLIGYSVNDTIVVFDRIREIRGKNPDLTSKMINDSVNQTLSRTLLTSLVTWLVVFVLYVAGGPGVHLFAFVMVVGVIVGTYSSIYIASPLLLMFGEGVHDVPMHAPPPRPSEGIMAAK